MSTSYQEIVFYHYILSNQNFLEAAKPDFFFNENVREIFKIAKGHTTKYKDPPTSEQLFEIIKIKGLEEKYSKDIIESIYNSKKLLDEYDKEWLDENVSAWIKIKNLEHVMVKSASFMKTSNITAENATEIVEKIRHMFSTETAIDFSFNMGCDFFDAASHSQESLQRTTSGYNYIDLCLKGGWWKGSLIVFLSGPKSGKSAWLQNLAAKSVMNGYNTAYITLELQEPLVNMRIGANMLNIPLENYEELAKDQTLIKNKLNELKKNSFKPLGQLHVKNFPASTMSTNDLRSYLIKAEELLGYKFENVFIDYLNIMKNWRNPNSENTYMKIKQISEDLRASADEGHWAFISVTQTNKDGINNENLQTTNVSESTALLHTVDGLFGIITSPEMKARNEYYLKYLADRVSGYENTRKKFNIDWKYFRISEDKNSPIEDLDFLMNSTVGNHNQPRLQQRNTQSDIAISVSNISSNNKQNYSELNNQENIKISGSGLF